VTAPATFAAGAVSGVAQPTQNFAPGITAVPHSGQNRIDFITPGLAPARRSC
jgi:hypothetical protein